MPTLEGFREDILFSMFKGEPGTRKSTAAVSYPTPQYWFSHDKKMNSIMIPMNNFGIQRSQIEYDNYQNWNDMEKKLELLQVNCKFKTVIVDSITSMGDSINQQTIKEEKGQKNKEGGNKGMMIGGISVNSIDHYKAEANAFMSMMAKLKDIHEFHGVNIILVAHVVGDRQTPTGAVTATHTSRIIVTGGKVISAKIPAYCSEIYHFDIDPNVNPDSEGEYGLLTVHTGTDYARTSLPLPRRFNFNNEPLYERFIKPAIEKQINTQPVTQL